MDSITFIYDDGGRAAAGFKGSAGDCVCRAVAIAAERPYAEVYAALSEVSAQARTRRASSKRAARSARNGIVTGSAAFKRYMESIGWGFTPTMAVGSGCRVHLRAEELPAGRIIVRLSRHLAAVIDGVLHDTHDCSRGGTRCVYGYWSKQEPR